MQRVLRRIESEKLRRALRRSLALWFFVTFVAASGVTGATIFFYQQATASGLGAYLTQLWAVVSTSPSAAFAHWQDILTSIGESLPVTGLMIVAAMVGLALWSADKVVGFSRKWRTV